MPKARQPTGGLARGHAQGCLTLMASLFLFCWQERSSTKNKVAPKIPSDRKGKSRGRKTLESSEETLFLASALIRIALGPLPPLGLSFLGYKSNTPSPVFYKSLSILIP